MRRGGLALAIYENSLTIALFLLFLASLFLHAAGGVSEYNSEQLAHGGQTVSLLAYMGTSRFWFESFQNWQSEYPGGLCSRGAVDLPSTAGLTGVQARRPSS